MSDDKFLERLRSDARSLRYEPDAPALTRLTARVRARLDEPAGVAHFIASWIRPLAASLTAIALAAAIGLTWLERGDLSVTGEPVEYSVGGDVYSVGD